MRRDFMKRFLFVAVAALLMLQLSCGGSASSGGALAWEADLKQALDRASKDGKPVMIFFTSGG
jgi:hypothetical protein